MIRVEKVAEGYSASVSPPHSSRQWSSAQPMSATEVLKRLADLGCHSTDITDALYDADPEWAVQHDQEVLRQRDRAHDE